MEYVPCGLALGGGALKGAAHVGILQLFEEEGMPIEYIAGTSAGSLVAAMYAIGGSAQHLLRVLEDFVNKPVNLKITPGRASWVILNTLLRRLKILNYETELGFIRGKNLFDYLYGQFGNQGFEGLRTPLLITAVDLLSGRLQVFTDTQSAEKLQTRREIDVHTGVDLATAVQASAAVPGIFTPVHFKGRILVDGAVRDNVPVDILRYVGAAQVVGVDLGFEDQTEERLDDIFAVLLQTIDLMGREATDQSLERYADLVLQPKIESISFTDYARMKDIYKIGYEEAREQLPALQARLRKDNN